MLSRAGQVLAGAFVTTVGAAAAVLPLMKLEEQPNKALLLFGGGLILAGLWLLFPVGMGRFGEWLADSVPWLDGDDDEAR